MTTLKNIMVDIETLGNGPDGMIVQIGAVAFDPFGGDAGLISTPEASFKFNVAPTGDPRTDGELEWATVLWWLQQEKAAQQRVFQPVEGTHGHIGTGALAFARWVEGWGEDVVVWANPPGFDLRLLRRAFARAVEAMPMLQTIGQAEPMPAYKWPVGRKAERCFRTLRKLGEVMGVPEPLRVGVHHDALDDAHHQAGQAIGILRAIRAAGVGSWIHQTGTTFPAGTLCGMVQVAPVPPGSPDVTCPDCRARLYNPQART